jgi:hypothetical protein
MPDGREKFRLNIVGADEDVPRLLLSYGRGCGGEVALVMRPRDGQAALVHQVKKQPAKVWSSDRSLAPDTVGDAPLVPATELPATDAVALVRRLKSSPPAKGPASLRGMWRGALFCTDGKPTMALERRVASYGTLKVRSDTDGHWHASFERDAKWFSTEKREETPASTTLVEAIQRGMVQMTGLVSEACSFRDTHRRNTVDIEYAMVHPPKERKDPKDPTERYRPRSHYAVVEAPTGFDVVNEAGVPVARFGGREKGKATQHAAALNRGRAPEGTEPVPSAPPPPSQGSVDDRFAEAMRTAGPGSWGRLTMMYASPKDVAVHIELGRWLDKYARTVEDAKALLDARDHAGEAGLRSDAYDELARRLRFEPIGKSTRRKKTAPSVVPPALAEIPAPAPPSGPGETQQAADATVREAEALDNAAQSLWGSTTDAPELVGRAGRLIRHAEALVKSPGCTGRDRQLAWEELKKAAAAYQALRDAMAKGEPPDVEAGLRRIAERVSLAAAKAAKSCATKPVPPTPTTPTKPKRGRPAKRPVELPAAPAAAPEVDPAKDQALANLFAQAVQAAAQNLRAA